MLRGGAVVRAVALGAGAVMIGRAYLWGLAASGQAGVENVLDILRGGIDSTLLGLGHASIHDLTPDDIVIPPGFTRTLGAGHSAGGENPGLPTLRDLPWPETARPARARPGPARPGPPPPPRRARRR